MRGLTDRIAREGPVPFSVFMDAALYGPEGFFTAGHGAGRGGRDFVTSPEVGALFGALVGRALDGWWHELGEPDPFVVVDAGAGRGRLAADVLRTGPECAPALRYVMVERSEALRGVQGDLVAVEPAEDALGPIVADSDDDAPKAVPGLGPIATSLAELPAGPFTGVVVANELLDNLPVDIVERGSQGWLEIRVAVGSSGFAEVVVPATTELATAAEGVAAGANLPVGARLPVPVGIQGWFAACGRALERGRVAVLDYGAPAAELARRGQSGWLRTYRAHRRGGDPLAAPGRQDLTCDLPLEFLEHGAERVGFDLELSATQADWLRTLGIDELTSAAREGWAAGAATGDLAAVAARSAVHEAAALLDPSGLGAHHVLVFRC